MTTPPLSAFARGLTAETAFDVLAVAKRLKAAGKDVIELQIGDSPYPSSSSAVTAGKAAIDAGRTRYAPSLGLPEFRAGCATLVRDEFGIPAGPENVVVAPGAKPFEQFFCELFLEPGDAVLVFEPAFPTYAPNIARRGARMVTAPLTPEREFRPDPAAVERFLRDEPRAKAVFLNSPHNPTGGVATKADLEAVAALLRGTGVALFSDEPYCHMVWRGRHHSPLAEPGMMERTVAAYTFSKSYSMSGWRLGFAVTSPELADLIGKMINTALSCAPPFVQLAGLAALEHDAAERDRTMAEFRKKVELLVGELRKVPGVSVADPAGTFYVFPDVRPVCRRLGITSHGLAMYLLEGADEKLGVACLGGECFGPAGQGFIRLSTAEPDDRLRAAVAFLATSVTRTDRVAAFLAANPKYQA
jgi:aspartate aminotransferase